MRGLVKDALGRLVSASRLDALLLRRTGVIVAFHRVQDGHDPEGLSLSREMFERHCRFFRSHFNVVPLRELVSRLERGETLNRHLAITFDDGYRDNFENARPVLEKLSLPATFFVVSRWIDTDAWPWWDREQGVRRRARHRLRECGARRREHGQDGEGERKAHTETIARVSSGLT